MNDTKLNWKGCQTLGCDRGVLIRDDQPSQEICTNCSYEQENQLSAESQRQWIWGLIHTSFSEDQIEILEYIMERLR